ncbi:alpha/beta-type small acid-soluble spore protein [Clostridium sp. OS1-26]|uniref:alpha/beta-type small acid-soluble spore protein n=1 Tax=Clostridium sp. OS1-26 TaxID=3070681 RepID=UPI0027E0088F|nr:alpha/beta-type small acid-soluble spore protein [Clostridium sp. OS1-26]WML36936.1 alpha/beta-type small acid-soluble spore protein [Clostridium sp. OS1-26]
MSNKRGTLIPKSQDTLDSLKEEVSNELGIKEVPHAFEDGHWGYIPAATCGAVGGSMVKKMIESFEKNLVSKGGGH